MTDYSVPPAFAGMRVGILGGSFNPPHLGHLHIVKEAFKRLNLDKIWVLVTPCNPLKSRDTVLPLEQRLSDTRRVIKHPGVLISGLEAGFCSSYTFETVRRLATTYPKVKFALIMGADNFQSLYLWRFWWRLVHVIPLAVVDRIEAGLPAVCGKVAILLGHARITEHLAHTLLDYTPPVWVFLHATYIPLSSSKLR